MRVCVNTSLLFQLRIHLLNVCSSDRCDFFAAESRLYVVIAIVPIPVLCTFSDRPGHIGFQPSVQPFAERHAAVFGQVGSLIELTGPMQLIQKLFLCFTVDIAVEGQAVFLMADDDAPFPQAVLLFANAALAVGSALCHFVHLLW